jgi:hypothetical protein
MIYKILLGVNIIKFKQRTILSKGFFLSKMHGKAKKDNFYWDANFISNVPKK